MRPTPLTSLCLALPLLALAAPTGAQDTTAPPAIEALQACRQIESVEAKAACYDAAVDALAAELDSGATVAVTRAEIEEARRESVGLPGFRLPGVGLVARDDAAGDAPAEATTVRVVEISRSLRGRSAFITETGQRWVQVDSEELRRLPDPPFEAELRPAFANTYFVTIAGRPGIRVRREE